MKPRKPFIFILLLVLSASAQAAEKEGFMDFFKKKTAPAAAVEETPETAPPVVAAPSVPSDERQGSPVENLTALESRMANNKSMTDAEKKQLAETMLKLFPSTIDMGSPGLEKQVLFFEQVSNDPNMKTVEKIAAIQKHFSELAKEPVKEETPVAMPKAVEMPEEEQPAIKETVETPKTTVRKNNFSGKK